MHEAIKEAMTICKTLMRNGCDAYVINAPLQESLLAGGGQPEVDIACETDLETLARLFPGARVESSRRAVAQLEENGALYRFYPLDSQNYNHPELSLLRITPSMGEKIPHEEKLNLRITGFGSPAPSDDPYDGFAKVKDGSIRLVGLPDETLRHNYLLAVRALRFAANFDAPIEENTWMAIARASGRVLDYVPALDIMREWRQVAAGSMHRFVRLLFDSHILHGLMPEVASLSGVPQQAGKEPPVENVFEHTLKCMELYPRDELHYDWLGAMAMLFHDVGKLFTAEYFDGRWTYYQHHRVGAKVTRKILRRLHFDLADTELVCQLVNNHMQFHFMMTDRGIRRFKSLGETGRLIAMARADLLSREESPTSFNHNLKYLARAETPERLIEPLLNGNEIMEETSFPPGRMVGLIRDALLAAQKNGEVPDRESAIDFVRKLAAEMRN